MQICIRISASDYIFRINDKNIDTNLGCEIWYCLAVESSSLLMALSYLFWDFVNFLGSEIIVFAGNFNKLFSYLR